MLHALRPLLYMVMYKKYKYFLYLFELFLKQP